MYRKISGSLFIFFILLLPVISFASADSTALVSEGRQLLFQNGNPTFQGIIAADKKFTAAVQADPSDGQAHVFSAITGLVSFVFENGDGKGFQTLADIIQAMGVPIRLDVSLKQGEPFGDFPILAGNFNPPDTMPNGDDLTAILNPGLTNVIDQSLSDLDKAGDDINIVLKARELGSDADIELDHTDILFAKACLNALKSAVLILSAYDLDNVDIRELIAFVNAGMMNIHPDMLSLLLTKYPDFLHLLSSNGAIRLSEAKKAFKKAYVLLDAAYLTLNNETDPQENDLFVLESEEDNQNFETILQIYKEMIDSLTKNRPATFQIVRTNWDVVTPDSNTNLTMRLKEGQLGNGTIVFKESGFGGLINSHSVYGDIPTWSIAGNQIELTLDYGGYKQIKLAGTLSADGKSITNGTYKYKEYNGFDWLIKENGTFTAHKVNQNTEDMVKLDLNALFGNNETQTVKLPLDIRNLLPEFGIFSRPELSTLPKPLLNGIFPDYTNTTDEKLLQIFHTALNNGKFEIDAPYQLFTIPIVANLDFTKDPATAWPASAHVTDDLYDDNINLPAGIDIKAIYLAKDTDFLYMAMGLGGPPPLPSATQDIEDEYFINFQGLRNYSTFQVSNYFYDNTGNRINKWNYEFSTNKNGNFFRSKYNDEYVHAGNNFIAWKIPLSDINPAETLGGAHLITFSNYIVSYDFHSYRGIAFDQIDGSDIMLGPVYKAQGSVSAPDGYTGGKIYFYLTRSPNFQDDGAGAITGTYIDKPGSFELNYIPYSSEDLYLHILWDKDGNGIRNSGDYTAMRTFKVENDVNIANIPLKDVVDLLSPVLRVINVLIGNTPNIDFSGYNINNDNYLDMKDIIPLLQKASDLR